ncbi:PhoH family protein [Aquirufa ecclesiirivi]|uniref:PhoH-like protein n=1 Tax=Aquirufa ecclesiirivi TaxID=2715124 RepID=A0ABT4JEX8_9BACT|nr:PhoH family protein [Aquirufa ecclesiirivi]MCZ2471994.1 PhoH family protein [Aquirufa ecclesiirivi]MCZ2474329.1 PhoH family protein [Aquirufa ecclesiirivi]MDF0693701.1 PhoH family protein [Aquirufa ecclesiirivi]NHC48379.1 PhoH family protein [Aquirufa ecclesiirivi]
MLEKIIALTDVSLVDFLGVSNSNLTLLTEAFPQTKIIARGDQITVRGSDDQISLVEAIVNQCIKHLEKHSSLSANHMKAYIDLILNPTGEENETPWVEDKDVLLFGTKGLVIKVKTPNQRKLVEAASKNDIVFAIGPAGTGKTYTAVALAVKALKNKEVKKIIITRPAVEAGENLGFLPGDLKEKIDPYLRPIYDALEDMIPAEKLKFYLENRTIEIAPLAYMRGRTLNKAFILLDEAQNTTSMQMKMFLTRMGIQSKTIITGDKSQVDLPKNQVSGLGEAAHILKGITGIAFVELDGSDVVRHRLVREIIEAYGKQEK